MALAGMLAAGGSADAAWVQRFNESGVGAFDHLQMQIEAPAGFATPSGINGFSLSGWADTYNDGNLLIANGVPAGNLSFNLRFDSPRNTSLTFYFQAWLGDILKEEATVNWGGGSWKIGTTTAWSAPRQESAVVSSVPAPSTLLLTGAGLIAIGYVRRRRSRERRDSFG
jgi:hypothetical protein